MATTVHPACERYRSGSWLTPRIVAFASGASLLFGLAAIGIGLLTAVEAVDAAGRPLGTDFTSFFSAGRLALAGRPADAYDWRILFGEQQALHGTGLFFPWSYPPVFLLVTTPLAALPYLPALALWQAGTLGAATAVLRAVLPGRRAFFCGLAAPAVLVCLLHGQTGFLLAALLGGAVLALPRRPLLAGLLFGLLAFKPQFALLVPICLLAAGCWRAIAAAAATVTASVLLPVALWGIAPWTAFLAGLVATEAAVLRDGGPGFHNFTSLFACLRGWGAPASTAYLAQAALAVAVAAVCTAIWRSGAELRLKGAALLSGALLCSPYVLDYDLVVLGMASAFLAAHGLARGFRPWQVTILAAAWIAPGLGDIAALVVPLPVGFLAGSAVFLAAARAALPQAFALPTRRLAAPA